MSLPQEWYFNYIVELPYAKYVVVPYAVVLIKGINSNIVCSTVDQTAGVLRGVHTFYHLSGCTQQYSSTCVHLSEGFKDPILCYYNIYIVGAVNCAVNRTPLRLDIRLLYRREQAYPHSLSCTPSCDLIQISRQRFTRQRHTPWFLSLCSSAN